MTVFSRYVLKNYLKVLTLATCAFIAILLVSRLEEIAHFATMGTPLSYIALFTLYQIPFILPIAIPISCLISALVLFQRLSHTHELTALRAGGFSILKITAPILLTSALLSIASLIITSELATTAHLKTRTMANQLLTANPLLLLQNAKIAKLKGAFVQMGSVKNGHSAKDLVIALNQDDELTLALAKKVKVKGGQIHAKQVSLIRDQGIENQHELTTDASQLAYLLRNKGWKIANDHLTLPLLRVREQTLRASGNTHKLAKCHTEFVRRFSLGLATFTFTLMGVAFGMNLSRNPSKRGIITVVLLAALTLATFFVAKAYDHKFVLASALFLAPHALIIGASLFTFSRIRRGVE